MTPQQEIEHIKARLTSFYAEQRAGFRKESPYCAGIFGATCRDTWAAMVESDIENASRRLCALIDSGARRYDIEVENMRTGKKVRCGLEPMTHEEACTMLSKTTRYPWRREYLVEV